MRYQHHLIDEQRLPLLHEGRPTSPQLPVSKLVLPTTRPPSPATVYPAHLPCSHRLLPGSRKPLHTVLQGSPQRPACDVRSAELWTMWLPPLDILSCWIFNEPTTSQLPAAQTPLHPARPICKALPHILAESSPCVLWVWVTASHTFAGGSTPLTESGGQAWHETCVLRVSAQAWHRLHWRLHCPWEREFPFQVAL